MNRVLSRHMSNPFYTAPEAERCSCFLENHTRQNLTSNWHYTLRYGSFYQTLNQKPDLSLIFTNYVSHEPPLIPCILPTQMSQRSIWCKSAVHANTGLFEMIVGVLTTCHLVLQMQPHGISFNGVTSRIRFAFLLFPQISRNWRNESEPPLKPSPLTCYKQFGTNSIIVLMFVESQRVHI